MHNLYYAAKPHNYTYAAPNDVMSYTTDGVALDPDLSDLSSSSADYEETSSSASVEAVGAEPQSRDWNREFQGYLKEVDPYVKYRKLSKLAKDFVSVAEEYGR